MALKISRAHATAPIVRSVTWDYDNGEYLIDKMVNGKFQKVAVTESFAVDIHMAQHGWQQFIEGKGYVYTLAPVSEPIPAKPEGKGKECYVVPVNSEELAGRRDLIVMGQAVTESFADWFDEMAEAAADLDDVFLPVVEVTAKDTDWGKAPAFRTVDFCQRPDNWRKPIVSFK